MTSQNPTSGMSKRMSYGKIYRPDVRGCRPDVCARPRLPCGCDFTRRRFLPSALVKIRPRGRELCPCGRTHSLPSPPLSCPIPSPPPSPANAVYCCRGRGRSKKEFFIFIYLFIYFWIVVAGLKREKKNSVFNPQDPQAPQAPRAPRASWAKT
jgi:hypothetical protein